MPDVPPAVSDPHNAPPPKDAPQIKEITQEKQAALLQAPSSTPPSTGGGYSLTPAQIESALAQCNTLVDALSSEAFHMEYLGQVTPPAPDFPGSVLQCQALKRFATALQRQNSGQVQYIGECIKNLNQAKQSYITAEHLTEDQWNRLASGFLK